MQPKTQPAAEAAGALVRTGLDQMTWQFRHPEVGDATI
jgi:hypothetical protein